MWTPLNHHCSRGCPKSPHLSHPAFWNHLLWMWLVSSKNKSHKFSTTLAIQTRTMMITSLKANATWRPVQIDSKRTGQSSWGMSSIATGTKMILCTESCTVSLALLLRSCLKNNAQAKVSLCTQSKLCCHRTNLGFFILHPKKINQNGLSESRNQSAIQIFLTIIT